MRLEGIADKNFPIKNGPYFSGDSIDKRNRDAYLNNTFPTTKKITGMKLGGLNFALRFLERFKATQEKNCLADVSLPELASPRMVSSREPLSGYRLIIHARSPEGRPQPHTPQEWVCHLS